MSVTTIILSKDRPAQLDLLLRSIERNGVGQFVGTESERPVVITATHALTFEFLIRLELHLASEFVCFMCDDGILYRDFNPGVRPDNWLCEDNPEILCVSLRLGYNTHICYPSGLPNKMPASIPWQWSGLDWATLGDFAYPGSIDGHIFRTADVQRMLAGKSFPNPTALECALVAGCDELARERPLMACYPHSVYVGNPVNRVSEQSGVRYGTRFPVTAAECNERFLRGERIDLDALDFSHVDGAHTEIELVWK